MGLDKIFFLPPNLKTIIGDHIKEMVSPAMNRLKVQFLVTLVISQLLAAQWTIITSSTVQLSWMVIINWPCNSTIHNYSHYFFRGISTIGKTPVLEINHTVSTSRSTTTLSKHLKLFFQSMIFEIVPLDENYLEHMPVYDGSTRVLNHLHPVLLLQFLPGVAQEEEGLVQRDSNISTMQFVFVLSIVEFVSLC